MKGNSQTMPRAFCCECGQPVRIVREQDGSWAHGRCQYHQWARRMPEGFVERAFASLKAAVEAAPERNHWRIAR